MTRTLRIGTRGSQLALVQANWVAARLAEHGVPTEITIIRTEGDDRPVDTAWGEGAFVGRIVGALLDGSVDLAVHSAKDVPTDEDARLRIAAYPPREDARDALVARERGSTLATLPRGARVGTDSPRRVAFLRAVRPDLRLHPLHGNVDTRLRKLDRGDSDALVLAVAGLARLGRADRIDEILPTALVAPAPGQGSLAVQVRTDDTEAVSAAATLDDPATRAAVEAERALLGGTGGGCRSPIGALGRVREDGALELDAAAERTWSPRPAAPLADAVARVVRVRGESAVAANAELAARLAARLVTARERPRVLLGRTDAQAAATLRALDDEAIDAVNVPAIEIVPVGPGSGLDAALASVAPEDRIVVTSSNAARVAIEAATRLRLQPDQLAWAAVGESTARALREAGAVDVFVPTAANAETLARELPLPVSGRVVVPRADIGEPSLVDALRARGATVVDVVAYTTLEAPGGSRARLARAFDDGSVDAVVVTSGSTARGLLALAADAAARANLCGTPAIALGDPSAAAAREAGFARVLVAPSPEPVQLARFVAVALGVRPARDERDGDASPAAEGAPLEPATTGGAT